MKTTIAAFALLALLSATASAELSITESKRKQKIDCTKEKEVTIAGDRVSVKLKGTCENVTVKGNGVVVIGSAMQFHIAGNKAKIAAGAAGEIEILGNDNTVYWRRGLKGKEPRITTRGNNNTVARRID